RLDAGLSEWSEIQADLEKRGHIPQMQRGQFLRILEHLGLKDGRTKRTASRLRRGTPNIIQVETWRIKPVREGFIATRNGQRVVSGTTQREVRSLVDAMLEASRTPRGVAEADSFAGKAESHRKAVAESHRKA